MENNQQSCLICDRIALIERKQNPYFVAELETGYIVIGDHQFYRGYSLFLSKRHAKELHELPSTFRKKFLWEMSMSAEAVYAAFKPKKLNYELLGNTDGHLHWHLFPRHADDPRPQGPVWQIEKNIRNSNKTKPSSSELKELVRTLRHSLSIVTKKKSRI